MAMMSVFFPTPCSQYWLQGLHRIVLANVHEGGTLRFSQMNLPHAFAR